MKRWIYCLVAVGMLLLWGSQNGWAQESGPAELTLSDSIEMALKNNPAMQIAEADRRKARWAFEQAKAAQGASLGLTMNGTRSEGGNEFVNNLALNLPLYSGGALEGNVKIAQEAWLAAELAAKRTEQQLRLNAATAYYDVLECRNLLQVKQESVTDLTAHLNDVKAQYDVGTVARPDLLRSEVELANAQQERIKADNAYRLAIAAWNNVIGVPITEKTVAKEELLNGDFSTSFEQCLQDAETNRPDLLQAKSAIRSAEAAVSVAASSGRPTVNLQAAENWQDNRFPGFSNNSWTAGLNLKWSLWDSGQTRDKELQATAALDKSRQQYRQTMDTARLEVYQQYLNVQEARQRIENSSVAVTKGEEDFAIAKLRYQSGVGTNLDVIDAQVALAQSKTNHTQALYDYNTAKAKLSFAVGK